MKKKNGNWTIKNSEKVFENDFFKVFDDEVIRPDGEDGRYGTVRFAPGVCVLPIDGDDCVYLTRQFRYVAERETLETVAGTVENETPLETAKRELKEELGITAEEFEALGTVQLDNSIVKNEVTFFIARQLSFGKSDREETEQIEMVKIKFRQAIEKVFGGEITHCLSCALLLKAWVQRGNEF